MSKFKLACEENYFIYSKIENERKKYLRLKEDQKSNNAKITMIVQQNYKELQGTTMRPKI